MTRVSLSLAATALLLASAAGAQTPAAKPAPAKTVKTVKTAKTTTTRSAKPAATGRMVTTKTSTGKTITYNCSLPGNAAKKACK